MASSKKGDPAAFVHLAIHLRKRLWVYLGRKSPSLLRSFDESTGIPFERSDEYYSDLLEYLWEKFKENLMNLAPVDRSLLDYLYIEESINDAIKTFKPLNKLQQGKFTAPSKVKQLEKGVLEILFENPGISFDAFKRFLVSPEIKAYGKGFTLIIGLFSHPLPLDQFCRNFKKEIENDSIILQQRIRHEAFKKPQLLTEENLARMSRIRIHHPLREWIDLEEDDLYVKRNNEENIDAFIIDCIANRHSGFVLVYGDAGTGKTTLLWKLFQRIKDQIENVEVHLWQSIEIDFSKKSDAIINQESIKGIIDALSGAKRLILLIDTLDIRLHSEAEKISLLHDIQEALDFGAIVVGTSRSEEADQFYQFVRQHDDANRRSFKLKDFDNKEMNEAVSKHMRCFWKIKSGIREDEVSLHVRELLTTVSRNQSMEEICRRPLTLRMLFTLYLPNKIPPLINAIELYREYWNKRVADDFRDGDGIIQIETKRSLERIAMQLASNMLAEGRPVLTRKPSPDENRMWGVSNGDMKLLSSRGIISYHQPSGRIDFFHQTFFEFAAAKAIVYLESLRQNDHRSVFVDLWSHVATRDQTLFVLPIFENALILTEAEPISVSKIGKEITIEMLRNGDSTLQRSGIFVYQHLAYPSYELQDLVLKLLATQGKILIAYFIKVASCIVLPERSSHLLQDLAYLYANQHSQLLFENFLLLLKNISILIPEEVSAFLLEYDIYGNKIESHLMNSKGQAQRGLTYPRTAHDFLDILSVCLKYDLKSLSPILYSILLASNKAKRKARKDGKLGIPNAGTTVRAHAILALYRYGGLESAPQVVEELIQSLHTQFRDEIGEEEPSASIPLFEFGLLWHLKWSSLGWSVSQILPDIECPDRIVSKSKIAGFFHHMSNNRIILSDAELKLLWNCYYEKAQNRASFFDWQAFFWKPLFLLPPSQPSVNVCRELVLGKIEESLQIAMDATHVQWYNERKIPIKEMDLENFIKFVGEWDVPSNRIIKWAELVKVKNFQSWIEKKYLWHLFARAIEGRVKSSIIAIVHLRDHYESSQKKLVIDLLRNIRFDDEGIQSKPSMQILLLELSLQLNDVNSILLTLRSIDRRLLLSYAEIQKDLRDLLSQLYKRGEFRYRFELHYYLSDLGIEKVPEFEVLINEFSKKWEFTDFEWLVRLSFLVAKESGSHPSRMEILLISVAKGKYLIGRQHETMIQNQLLSYWKEQDSMKKNQELAFKWLLDSFAMNSLEENRIPILYQLSSYKREESTEAWHQWLKGFFFSNSVSRLGPGSKEHLAQAFYRNLRDLMNRLYIEKKEELLMEVLRWPIDLDEDLGLVVVYAIFSDPTLRLRVRKDLDSISSELAAIGKSTYEAIHRRQQGFDRIHGSDGWRTVHEIVKQVLGSDFSPRYTNSVQKE